MTIRFEKLKRQTKRRPKSLQTDEKTSKDSAGNINHTRMTACDGDQVSTYCTRDNPTSDTSLQSCVEVCACWMFPLLIVLSHAWCIPVSGACYSPHTINPTATVTTEPILKWPFHSPSECLNTIVQATCVFEHLPAPSQYSHVRSCLRQYTHIHPCPRQKTHTFLFRTV